MFCSWCLWCQLCGCPMNESQSCHNHKPVTTQQTLQATLTLNAIRSSGAIYAQFATNKIMPKCGYPNHLFQRCPEHAPATTHHTHVHQRHDVHLKVDCPMHVCNHSADTKETMYSTCSGTNFDINHTSKLSLWCLLGGYPKSVCRLCPKQTADSTQHVLGDDSCQRCAKHACACNHTADTTLGQL